MGVIGCGTAGSAAALFLARAGHHVTLYERVAVPGPAGAGIVLQPSGMAALAELGLLEAVVSRGAPIHALLAQTPAGKPVVRLSYRDLAADLYGLGLHRGVLFDTLFQAVCREERVRVQCGVDIGQLQSEPDGQTRLLDTASGQEVGRHQLVVVADGARSVLREGSGLVRKARRYPYGALWFVGVDPDRRFEGRLFQVVDGTRRLLGLLPTGVGPGEEPEVPLVSLFWSLRADRVDAWRAAGLKAWKADVERLTALAAPVLEQIEAPGQVLFSEYHDVVLRRWHTDRVVFLGDAAHATSPQLGQGCNLALVDARVLCEVLALDLPLPQQLAEYSRRRRWHLAWYQFATRALTPLFQSDLDWLGRLRDAAMGWSCGLPFVGRQMLQGMAGVSRGPLLPALKLSRRPPALPAP